MIRPRGKGEDAGNVWTTPRDNERGTLAVTVNACTGEKGTHGFIVDVAGDRAHPDGIRVTSRFADSNNLLIRVTPDSIEHSLDGGKTWIPMSPFVRMTVKEGSI